MGDPEKDERVREFMEPPLDPPAAVPTRDLTVDGPHGPVPVRVYGDPRSTDGADRPALLWIHGGAFMFGDLDMPEADWTAREICARTGGVVVSVDYRLAVGGVHHPVPLDDCVAATRWLRDHAAELGVDAGPDLPRRRQRRRQPGPHHRAAAPRRGRLGAGRAAPRLPRGRTRPCPSRRPRWRRCSTRCPRPCGSPPRARPASTPTTSAARRPTATRSRPSPTWRSGTDAAGHGGVRRPAHHRRGVRRPAPRGRRRRRTPRPGRRHAARLPQPLVVARPGRRRPRPDGRTRSSTSATLDPLGEPMPESQVSRVLVVGGGITGGVLSLALAPEGRRGGPRRPPLRARRGRARHHAPGQRAQGVQGGRHLRPAGRARLPVQPPAAQDRRRPRHRRDPDAADGRPRPARHDGRRARRHRRHPRRGGRQGRRRRTPLHHGHRDRRPR